MSGALQTERTRLAEALHPGAQPAIALVQPGGRVRAATDPTACPSLAATALAVRAFFGEQWAPGDAAVTNDPFSGGVRVTDLTLVRGDVVVRVAIPDIGGFHLGGLAPESFDVWGEGARFTPLRVEAGGRPRREALDLLALNSRTPRLLRRCVEEMARTAERVERLDLPAQPAAEPALAGLRRGPHTAEAPVESTLGRPWVRVALTVAGNRLELDFGASDPQVEAPLNSTAAHTADCALGAIVDALPGFPPLAATAGAVRVAAGEGTVAGARVPALTGLSPYLTARAIRRAVTAALAAAGAPVDDPDGWWRRRGEAAFAAAVDPETLRLRPDVAARLRALEERA